jgi:hypothetical protein
MEYTVTGYRDNDLVSNTTVTTVNTTCAVVQMSSTAHTTAISPMDDVARMLDNVCAMSFCASVCSYNLCVHH